MPNENDDGSLNPSDPPKALTEADIGNLVNAAVTNHLKRFAEKTLPTILEASLKPHLEKITAAPTPPPGDEGEQAPKGSKKDKKDPELLALQDQFKAVQEQLAAEKTAREAVEKKARDDKAYSELRSSLEGKVRPELVDLVASHLFHVEKRVAFAEDGSVLFRAKQPLYQGSTEMEDVELPLRAGIDGYLKGDNAKAYLPAPSQGAEAPKLPKKPIQGQPVNGAAGRSLKTPEDKVAAAAEAEARAKRALGL